MNQAVIGGEKLQDGKYIIVQKDSEIEDGDIVVAIIDNCATVKRFKKGKNMVILYPDSDNPLFQPIYLDSNSDSLINGKVIQILENPAI